MMKIRLRWWSQFKKLNLTSKILVILSFLCTFCGNTVILQYVTIMMLMIIIVMLLTRCFERLGKDIVVNQTNRLLVFLLGVFSFFLLIQSFISFNATLTRTYAIRYCIYTILLLLITHVETYNILITMFKGYSWIAGISSLVMTVINGRKSGGFLGDYQAVGMMMSIACIIFVIDYFENNRNFSDILGYLLSLVCVFVSGKRTFSLLAILCLVGMYCITNNKHKNWKTLKIVIIISTGLFVLYYFFPPIRELVSRMVELSAGQDEFTRTSGRSEMWKVAMEMFFSHKIYGVGFATFGVYTGRYYGFKAWSGLYLTHNIYYGLLAETGLIGFTLMVAFIFYAFIWSYSKFLKYRTQWDTISRRVALYSIFIQLWFIIYGYSGNGIYDSNEFFFYVIAIAMMVAVVQETRLMEVLNYNCHKHNEQIL